MSPLQAQPLESQLRSLRLRVYLELTTTYLYLTDVVPYHRGTLAVSQSHRLLGAHLSRDPERKLSDANNYSADLD